VLKGPTAAFMAFAALDLSARGAADFYGDLLDGIVSDEPPWQGGPRALQIDTGMADAPARARVAAQVLEFAGSLAE
jgi:LPPG:FO 2-phospho-L-lactate transferase